MCGAKCPGIDRLGTDSGIWCFGGFFRVPFRRSSANSAGSVYAKPASGTAPPQRLLARVRNGLRSDTGNTDDSLRQCLGGLSQGTYLPYKGGKFGIIKMKHIF